MIDCSELFSVSNNADRYLGISRDALEDLVKKGALRTYRQAFPKTAKTHLKAKLEKQQLSIRVHNAEVSHEIRTSVEAALGLVCERLRASIASKSREIAEQAFRTLDGQCLKAKIVEVGVSVRLEYEKVALVLPPSEQVSSDTYKVGAAIGVYVSTIGEYEGASVLLVSRRAASLFEWYAKKFFDSKYGGLVRIGASARNATRGESLLAVSSDFIDPLAKQNECETYLRKEFPQEKVVLVRWYDRPEYLIASGFEVPIKDIVLHESTKTAVVEIFREDEDSRADYSSRQELVSMLTKWHITVHTSSDIPSHSIGMF